MKTTKNKLPKASVNNRYTFKNAKSQFIVGVDTTSQGDPSNSCTTILTSTHFF